MADVKKYGIVAKRHSGKTTLANILIERGDFQKVAFADPLKDLWVEMYNLFLTRIGQPPSFTREQLEREKELHRLDLERLGTVHGRRIDDECWIRLAQQKIAYEQAACNLFEEDIRFVCDDVRFLNEVQTLRDLGFTIVKITRPEADRRQSILEKLCNDRLAALGHAGMIVPFRVLDEALDWAHAELQHTLTLPSEVEVDRIEADIEIENTTLEALEQAALSLINGDAPPPVVDFYCDTPLRMAA